MSEVRRLDRIERALAARMPAAPPLTPEERAAKIAYSPGASKRGGKKSGSGGDSKQGGTTAQKKAAGRKGGKAAAKKRSS